jgi:hypothetical protein
MSACRGLFFFTLVFGCASSHEPRAGTLPSSGGGASFEDAGAAASGGPSPAAGPDGGLTPASAGAAGLPRAECRDRQRRYFEDHGFSSQGSVRGLLEALNAPEGFWQQLPYCSGER